MVVVHQVAKFVHDYVFNAMYRQRFLRLHIASEPEEDDRSLIYILRGLSMTPSSEQLYEPVHHLQYLVQIHPPSAPEIPRSAIVYGQHDEGDTVSGGRRTE